MLKRLILVAALILILASSSAAFDLGFFKGDTYFQIFTDNGTKYYGSGNITGIIVYPSYPYMMYYPYPYPFYFNQNYGCNTYNKDRGERPRVVYVDPYGNMRTYR